MLRKLVGTCGLLLLCGGTVFAQTSASSPQPNTEAQPTAAMPGQPSQGGRVRQHTIQGACWKQAGIAPQMVNDRWKIEDRGKSRIAAVCTDPRLSAAQKHNKIMQINGDTDEEVAQVIPSKQLEAFKACQAEQDKAHPKQAAARELGPCGGIITPPPPKAGAEHGH